MHSSVAPARADMAVGGDHRVGRAWYPADPHCPLACWPRPQPVTCSSQPLPQGAHQSTGFPQEHRFYSSWQEGESTTTWPEHWLLSATPRSLLTYLLSVFPPSKERCFAAYRGSAPAPRSGVPSPGRTGELQGTAEGTQPLHPGAARTRVWLTALFVGSGSWKQRTPPSLVPNGMESSLWSPGRLPCVTVTQQSLCT